MSSFDKFMVVSLFIMASVTSLAQAITIFSLQNKVSDLENSLNTISGEMHR